MTLDGTKPEVDAARPVRKKVLIVEDNDLNMKLFNDLLVAHGYGTLQTKDGVEALALARQHRPDLILMDIQLPEVSGLQVTQWIKGDADLRMIPIIAVTAFAMKGDEENLRGLYREADLGDELFANRRALPLLRGMPPDPSSARD